MMRRPALILGLTFLDNIFYELDAFPLLGTESFASEHAFAVGGIAITAVNLAKLGVDTSFLTSLGTDVFGRLLETELQNANLQLMNFPTADGRTNQSVAIVHGGERAFLTTLGKSPHEEDLLQHWLSQPPIQEHHSWHLHLGLNSLDSWDTIKAAKKRGLTVSVSISHPSIALFGAGEISQEELWNHVDLVFLNEQEAQEITGSSGSDMLALLGQATAITAVTRGEQGAWLAVDAENLFSCESLKVNVADTTGAGDSFASGFLAGYLCGKTFPDCLALGASCGSLSTTALGGVQGFPTSMAEAERWAEAIQVIKLSNIDK
ncbi:MAG: carbohydrate kinase family protein [Limnochordia bacterium]|nr:carbohydrate kinase family protein [Limnochordia bacterium]